MELIKNRTSLLRYHKSKALRDSLNALEFALKTCSPEVLVKDAVELNNDIKIGDIDGKKRSFPLPKTRSILVIAVGKASEKMMNGLFSKLHDKISKGILIVPKGYDISEQQQSFLRNVTVIQSSHPIPNTRSLFASKSVVRELQNLDNIDMVIFLISGGSSSLIVSPLPGLALSDKREINRILISCGADINEINIVRKHLSQIKGGKILRFLNPRRQVVSLILSDVVGDDLSTIGSGLTYYDNSSFGDAISILRKYSIFAEQSDSIPKVSDVLKRGLGDNSLETVKLDEFQTLSTDNFLIGNNSNFCQKIISHLTSLGYVVDYKGSNLNMSTTEFLMFAKEAVNHLNKDKTAIVVGGELTTVIDKSKKGIGGRNQESICKMIKSLVIPKGSDYCIICFGTDGIDGSSKSAGGFLSPFTLESLRLKGLDVNSFIESHNSNLILKDLHSTIETGYTGTNFNDVYLFVKRS
ncbi:putative hydroxypyruvate reductase [Candidatus Nitrosocosmicus franklandus]|uniref:Putative hydroxypyruvate reductase n=1 Tax=Candidatus Nitrosocosmicus franklandianus TaxID=1798806 RepID=A0A484III1_9ARCH|nr:putative hydroxypyruvate reductase [Candidatus Nitrosocosmicus franklandus]